MDNFSFRRYTKETKDIIIKMLLKNPDRRITPEQALKHRYFVRNGLTKEPNEYIQNNQLNKQNYNINSRYN